MKQVSNSHNSLLSLSHNLKISTLVHPGKEVDSSHPLNNHDFADDKMNSNLRVSISKNLIIWGKLEQ